MKTRYGWYVFDGLFHEFLVWLLRNACDHELCFGDGYACLDEALHDEFPLRSYVLFPRCGDDPYSMGCFHGWLERFCVLIPRCDDVHERLKGKMVEKMVLMGRMVLGIKLVERLIVMERLLRV